MPTGQSDGGVLYFEVPLLDNTTCVKLPKTKQI